MTRWTSSDPAGRRTLTTSRGLSSSSVRRTLMICSPGDTPATPTPGYSRLPGDLSHLLVDFIPLVCRPLGSSLPSVVTRAVRASLTISAAGPWQPCSLTSLRRPEVNIDQLTELNLHYDICISCWQGYTHTHTLLTLHIPQM